MTISRVTSIQAPKRHRRKLAAFALMAASGAFALWWMSGPQIVGILPAEDLKAVRKLVELRQPESVLTMVLHDPAAFSDILSRSRDGRLIRFEAQTRNRVLVFVTTSVSSHLRLYIVDRSTNGWWISATNTATIKGK